MVTTPSAAGGAAFPIESNATSGGYYMQNLVSIAEYLISNGYSPAAAAGVAGTIAGESTGNPSSFGSAGAGLLGWTPPSAAKPTPLTYGPNPGTWDAQLIDMLTYANDNSAEAVARGGVDLASLKKATSPTQAAEWWTAFEGPLVPGSDIRNGVVNQVYSQVKNFKPNSAYTTAIGGAGTSAAAAAGLADTAAAISKPAPYSALGVPSVLGQVSGLSRDVATGLDYIFGMFGKGQGWRIAFFVIFAIFALLAVGTFTKGAGIPIPVPV